MRALKIIAVGTLLATGAAYAGLLYLELPVEYPADIRLSLEPALKNRLTN